MKWIQLTSLVEIGNSRLNKTRTALNKTRTVLIALQLGASDSVLLELLTVLPEEVNLVVIWYIFSLHLKLVPFLGRLLWVDLITYMGRKMSVCPYIRPSIKGFFDLNEIWYVCRSRWVMHEGMQYDLIHGQGQSHEPLKVGKSAIFKGCLLPQLWWGLANDHSLLN